MAVTMPDPATLLDAWDACAGRTPVDRALLLLALDGSSPGGDPSDLSIGERNAGLLDLREALFGSQVDAIGDCPGCGARLELSFATAGLRAQQVTSSEPQTLDADGYSVTFRSLTSRDLASAARAGEVEEVRLALLTRCVLSATRDGDPVSADGLPDAVIERVAEALKQADPQASIELSLVCADCNHEWDEAFDIASLLWGELDGWARRTLREVHDLARAYGWSEREALSLSPRRRQSYLRLVYDA